MQLYTNVGYDNILSKFGFQSPGLKVTVTVGIFKLCHHSSAYIYQLLI